MFEKNENGMNISMPINNNVNKSERNESSPFSRVNNLMFSTKESKNNSFEYKKFLEKQKKLLKIQEERNTINMNNFQRGRNKSH